MLPSGFIDPQRRTAHDTRQYNQAAQGYDLTQHSAGRRQIALERLCRSGDRQRGRPNNSG